LRDDHSPETLTIVSNDARVRAAAIRGGCRVWRCADYVDALMKSRKPAVSVEPDEKDVAMSPHDEAEWLKAFGK
jgi:hypothetical protein